MTQNDTAQRNHAKLVPGNYYELINPIEPIPSGVYRLEEVHDESLFFRIGKTIMFAISGASPEAFRAIPGHAGSLKRTTASNFLDAYYENLAKQKELADDTVRFDRPFTMCAVHPSVAREVH